MNAFFQELVRAGLYKRSQGRITRQVTWLAAALVLGLGLWQLSGWLQGWDPGLRVDKIRAETDGLVKFPQPDEIAIVDSQGQELERHAIPAGAQQTVDQNETVEAGTVLCQRDPLSDPRLRAGLCFGLPGLLLVVSLWIAYRMVNVPSVADFLIAVEAEMNKVSWPSRAELFRASMVVLFTIFFLAAVLFGFDSFWRFFFDWLDLFPKKPPAEAALAGWGMDWQAWSSLIAKAF